MLVKQVEFAFELAQKNQSKLTPDILRVSGMSSPKVRHFLNNLCSFGDANYLEIGSLYGSTIISAAYRNTGYFIGIDNFSEFGGSAEQLYTNKARFGEAQFDFIEGNCWDDGVIAQVPLGINVFFYDGGHTREDHYNAIVTYFKKVSNEFIYVCDDWNWEDVRLGTNKAIFDCKLITEFEKFLFTPYNGDLESWWNGLGIFVLRKLEPDHLSSR